MPTPIAHTGFALAVALAARPSGRPDTAAAMDAATLIVLANLADIDFLPGVLVGNAVAWHHGATHSILFAGLTASIALFLRAARPPGGVLAGTRGTPLRPSARWGLACSLAALSHPVLDWLTGEAGADVQTYGIEAFWPVSTTRYMSDWHAFGAYHIDTMGLFGGVLTAGALGNLGREVGFAAVCIGLAAAGRWVFAARIPQG